MKPLLQISKLRKGYGGRTLFEDATATFGEKQKIAVVGRNGAGKSTLFRIITGEEEADAGDVIRSGDLRLAYLEQKDPFSPEEGVLEFLQRYTDREDWECGKIAGRFHLKNELLERTIGSLPGGYQMRVKLAAMLLQEPNFLLLDEPTNYLDLNTLILLENFLRSWNGGFLVISHDREFLKRTTEHTLEVEGGDVFLYPGDLEEYFEFKQEQREQALAYNKNVEARRKELQTFVDRFRAKASKATQAKSKAKQLEKLETIEIGTKLKTVRMRIPEPEGQGNKKGLALRAENLAIGYKDPERVVADGIDLEIERGAHVAVLGENGQGKSTLLKTLAGRLDPLGGSFQWTGAVRAAYYAQHVYANLDPKADVFTTLERAAAPGINKQQILEMAGSFLFRGEDTQKPVSVLSGGERARLSLAGLLLGRSEVLLLDEPTNHLDFETVEALGEALRNYSGAVFFVSHDRTFVSLSATQILEVADGEITRYPGRYDEYVDSLQKRLLDGDGATKSASKKAATARKADRSAQKKNGAANAETQRNGAGAEDDGKNRKQLKKERQAELRELRKELRENETRRAKRERERDELTTFFADNPGDYSRDKHARLEEVQALLATEEERWLELQTSIEELETLQDD